MEKIVNSIFKLQEKGYTDIEHHDDFLIAKSCENGKYYLFSSKELKPIKGSESDQIKVYDNKTIYLVRNGSINTFTWADDWNKW